MDEAGHRRLLRPKMMSFDVFGTLISVRDSSYSAFERVLAGAGAHHIDVKTFWEHWEHRNIAHYRDPYRSYREICEISLAETFAHFRIAGDSRLIGHYFDAFPKFFLYDVVRTLEALSRRHKLAVVSNIDDDLLALTPLKQDFDLVCTAQRARGYKPDGALFRYLIDHAGVTKRRYPHSGQSSVDRSGRRQAARVDDRVDQSPPDSPRSDCPAPGFYFPRYPVAERRCGILASHECEVSDDVHAEVRFACK